MNFTKRMLLMAMFLFMLSGALWAVSETAFTFLTIEPGARASAMGQTYCAIADDATAAYWNPGGLAFLQEKKYVTWHHSNWLEGVADDMYFEYLAYNQFLEDWGTVGANVSFLTYGEQEKTGEIGDKLGTFESYEIAAGLSYATMFTEDFGFGLNMKLVYSHLADNETGQTSGSGEATSFAIDLGLLKRNFLIRNLDLGWALSNIGPDAHYIDKAQADPMPINFRLGLAYTYMYNDFLSVVFAADFNKIMDDRDSGVLKRLFTSWVDDDSDQEWDDSIQNIGMEVWYNQFVAARIGYVHDVAGAITGMSYGGGLRLKFMETYALTVDYAFRPGGELLDYNEVLTVGLEF